MRGLLLLAITLVILAGAGCAKKENAGSSSADNATPSTQSAAPAGVNAGAEAEGENERVDVTGTVPQLMTRVHDQEAQLDQVIKAAKLADVHKHAFAIRDLVVAAAGQTRLVTAAQKSELESHVAKVKGLASALDAAGDAGDLGKTKTTDQEFETHLNAIHGMLDAAGR